MKLIVEALVDLKGALEKNLQKPLQEIQRASQPLGTAFGEIRKAIGEALPKDLQTAGKAFAMLSGTMKSAGAAGLALTGIFESVIDIGKQMSQFVQLASPATVQMFNRATEDLMAVIGRGLTPIMELVTQVVRTAADSLGGFAKVGALVAQGLKPLAGAFTAFYEMVGRVGLVLSRIAEATLPQWEAMSLAVTEFVKAIQPAVDVLTDLAGQVLADWAGMVANVIQELTPYVVGFTRAMADLVKFFADATRSLLALIGIKLPDESGTRPGSSVGAAARGASHSNINQLINRTQESAFSLGAAATPLTRVASSTEALNVKADEIHKKIIEGAETVVKIYNDVHEAIERAKQEVIKGTETVGKVANVVAPGLGILEQAIAASDRFTHGNFGFGGAR
jgi:methyl-accepting chemotaxis protein